MTTFDLILPSGKIMKKKCLLLITCLLSLITRYNFTMDGEHNTQLTKQQKEATLDSEIAEFKHIKQQELDDIYYQPQPNAGILSQTLDMLGNLLATTKKSLDYHIQSPELYVLQRLDSKELLSLENIDALNKIARSIDQLIKEHNNSITQEKNPLHNAMKIQEFIQQHNLGIRDSEQEQFLKTLLEEIKALKRGVEITQVLPAEKKREIIGLKDQATQTEEKYFSK